MGAGEIGIGALAQSAGVPVETVRYYEKKGLLPAAKRAANGYRRYDAAHVAALALIRHCRALDLSLDEISQLQRAMQNSAPDCAGVDALIEQHLAAVSHRIAELVALQARLTALRGQCSAPQPVAGCGILQALHAVQVP